MSLEAAGFLLAGGKSSRMGRDKALLEFQGETLAERGLLKLREVCAEVAIAGGSAELLRFGRVIPDGHAGFGPLGGIVAALEQSAYEWNLFLAVDMPFVPVAALRQLLLFKEKALIVVSQTGEQLHPLCGVYSSQALPFLRNHLESGRLKVKDAIEATGSSLFVTFTEESWFQNLNTAEDVSVALHELSA